MSIFLHHEPCPRCGSRDNLAVFDDGHKWCFGCKYAEFSNPSIKTYREKIEKAENKFYTFQLPEDFDYYIPEEGRKWLQKYGIKESESIKNHFGWSKQGVFLKNKNIQVAPLLVFPIFDEVGHLLMWQGRNFGKRGPKYLTYGAKDVYHILGNSNIDILVLTEDLLSAIKVSSIVNAMPLWGSYMSLECARILSKRFSKVVLWLDKDKAQEAVKQAFNVSYLFKEGCSCIRTEKDPKEYSEIEIKEIVNDVL